MPATQVWGPVFGSPDIHVKGWIAAETLVLGTERQEDPREGGSLGSQCIKKKWASDSGRDVVSKDKMVLTEEDTW